MRIDVLQETGDGFFHRIPDAGLRWQTGQRGVLFARSYQGLQDRLMTHRDGLHFDYR